jgi:glutathione S-transferase
MVLKLFGMPMATCARRVATILVEKKVPFEFVLVDFSKAEHKSPAYLASQPFGQVPYIVCPPLLGAVRAVLVRVGTAVQPRTWPIGRAHDPRARF